MGGGDLNLKKSWHPSTLRNIERVWKAEQKHEAEQKKIEQLQRELEEERSRQEMRQYAEDQGVVRRKSERLDWMYQGPSAMVNREDYLTGRPVDKTFELMQEVEKRGQPKSDGDNVPSSIFSPAAEVVTVDMANKIREDPLFMIRKQEEENRKQLLNNPVRMKQLQQLLRQQVNSKRSKSKKSKKDKSKHQHHKKRRHHSSGSSSSTSSDEASSSRHESRSYKRLVEESRRKRLNSYSDDERKSKHSKRSESVRRVENSKVPAAATSDRRERSPPVARVKPSKKLDAQEMERRRQEMAADAKWRDEIRTKNVKRYQEEDKKEQAALRRGKSSDFIKPMLAKAAAQGTVESRIKSNVYNIQRSRTDMESHFARR